MKPLILAFLAGCAFAICLGAASNSKPQVGRYMIGSDTIIDTTNGQLIAFKHTLINGGVTSVSWQFYPGGPEYRGVPSHLIQPQVERDSEPLPIPERKE